MPVISVLIQLCLIITLGIHRTACSINLFRWRSYCVQTSHFICGAYRLTVFFAVGMSTDGFLRAGYTMSFFVSLTLSLLDFLRLLLTIFKYSIYLFFFITCFFSTKDCAFPLSKSLVNFGPRDLGEMERCSIMSLHNHYVCSWTFLCLLENLSISKMPVNLIQYREAVGRFNNRHSSDELKYRNLFLRSQYHNNILANCFFSGIVASSSYYFS